MTGNSTKSADQGRWHSRSAFSIIVPMLNEIELLPDLLAHLQYWQRQGCEVLLVDGGSQDGSAKVAESIGFKVIRSARGRAVQMNAGATQANGSVLVFLHADTRLPKDGLERISRAIYKRRWGRFDVHISGDTAMLNMVAFFMNGRSRLTGIATGDQAIFVERTLFEHIQGYPEQPLMEDIELSKRLLCIERPACLSAKVVTSGRRWLQRGIWRTIGLMWRLRWAYWRGVPPEQLVKRYE
ncbi:TIGR04283 family arsenosugar biosynthesis glycosyltransferase [Nitrosococcus oceani]|nr:TIGR04283 family arsenosugar biosynthesis glycosyltransferase [Nitrosococcus oceani]KFI23578.1 glycosyl transferase [Nitrosococcus oceani]